MPTITATVELIFQVNPYVLDSVLDHNTGEVDIDRLAYVLNATLGRHEAHGLTVISAHA